MSPTVGFLPCTNPSRGRARRNVILSAAMVAGLASVASGQLTTWTGGTPGSWSVAGNWNNGVPNAPGATALIDNGNAQNTSVSVNSNFTVGTLVISAGDSVSIGNNLALVVQSLLNNAGTVTIAAGANSTSLSTGVGSLLLNGGGNVVMSGANAIIGNSGTLTNADNTISGQGAIGGNGMSFFNQGTVNANVNGGSIFLDPVASGWNNSGTFTASNGGILRLNGQFGGGLTNTGTVTAQDGSTVQFENSFSISGGTFATSGSGVIRTLANNTVGVASVANLGNWTLDNNSTTNYSGDLFNAGSINVNAAGNDVTLGFNSGTTNLTGGGTINMGSTGAGEANIGNGNGRLVNVNNLVRGAGRLGNNNQRFTNGPAGVVQADVTGVRLLIDPIAEADGFVNNGILRATSGGLLQLTGQFGGGITNNGTISAQTGSAVQLFGGIGISGGAFTSSGTGLVEVFAGNTAFIGNSLNAGTLAIQNASTLNASGTLNNSGAILLNPVGSNAVFASGSGTLLMTGSGVVILNAGTNGLAVFGSGNAIDVNTTIRGAGVVANNNTTFVNRGTINADQPGKALFVDPIAAADGFVNHGVMTASNGGVLQFSGQFGGGVTNNGTISAQTGSTAQLLAGIGVAGGTFTSSGAGLVEVAPGQIAFIANTANSGTMAVQNASTLNASGTLNNSGTILLNPAGSNAALNSNSGTLVITGGGVILLSPGSGGAAVFGGSGNTIDLSSTVRGRGAVANNNTAIINRGLITASGGGEILVDPAGFANSFLNLSTLRAETGSQLHFNGQFGGGINNAGGHIDINAGGTLLTNSGHGLSGGTMTLDGGWNATNSSNSDLIAFRGNGTLNISNSARVGLFAGGGTVGTSRVASLSIATNGKLDLTDHDFVIDYAGASPLNTVRTQILSGFNGGAWTGAGITSDNARIAASTPDKTGVGYTEATDLGSPALFGGLAVDATSVLLRYTLLGDANLDRMVNIADFSRLGANYNTSGPWFNGDFNYDGQVGIGDFSLLASNYNKSVPAATLSRGGAVPEPAGLGVLAAVGAICAGRRRRG